MVAGTLEAPGRACSPLLDDPVLPCDDRRPVDSRLCVDAESSRGSRNMRSTRTRDHRLRRRTADVHARASEVVALDQQGPHSGFSQAGRERAARLAGTSDDHVERVRDHSFEISCLEEPSSARRDGSGIERKYQRRAVRSASARPIASMTMPGVSRAGSISGCDDGSGG